MLSANLKDYIRSTENRLAAQAIELKAIREDNAEIKKLLRAIKDAAVRKYGKEQS